MELSTGGGGGGGGGTLSGGGRVGSGALNVSGSNNSVRAAVQDLFNLYLARPSNNRSAIIQHNSKVRVRTNTSSPSGKHQLPKDEQFTLDFLQLQNHFPDPEQLRSSAESVLASLLVQCSSHSIQVEFLLFALQTLARLGVLHWDSFIPLLLHAVGTLESSAGLQQAGLHNSVGTPQGPQSSAGGGGGGGGGNSHMMLIGGGGGVGAPPSVAASPAPSSTMVNSPALSVVDVSTNFSQSSNITGGSPFSASGNSNKIVAAAGAKVLAWLCPLICKILSAALETDPKPAVVYDILVQVVSWINQWDLRGENGIELQSVNGWDGTAESSSWLHSCVELIWTLIDENKCKVPFYALLHGRSQLQIEHWPEDEELFALFLEVHRRRDKIALHMLMLDHHLHCPTFATLRMTALTYPGTLGEPLHGEDIANAVSRGSLDWERAMRCLSHALRCNPSADWWRRVLVFAPRYRKDSQSQTVAPRPGPVSMTQPAPEFSSDMICEAVVDRIMELMQPLQPINNNGSWSIHVSMTESGRWQEWLIIADLFYFFMRSGFIDFLEFVDKLAIRFARGEQAVIRSNHVTWLLAQVFRLETVTAALSTDSRKLETAQKILSFHMAEKPVDQTSNMSPQNMLLDFVGSSQTLRLWSINRQMMEQITGNRMPEHIQKGKQIDEWWKQVAKGERVLDYSNLDDKSMGMVWVLSHTVSQPICESIMNWINQKGHGEVIGAGGQAGERMPVVLEVRPLPILLLSGLSLHLCFRLINNIEEVMLAGQIIPSIGMIETYVRLLLVAPQTLFRHHAHGIMQRFQQGLAKPGLSLLLLELMNYRLIPLYRYQGKTKQLIFDIAKILITVKVKRGEHRQFRLAENLAMNLILSLREVVLIKKELKGATTEFTETLNRAMVINLAFTMKTRGIAEIEQLLVLQPALDQILASTYHKWSEKTLRHFPPTLRDAIKGRPDKRPQIINQWQQVEATVLHHCRQLLAPSHDPSYILTALNAMNHSFPQHRQYLCAGAWMLMDGHPESINTVNLGRIMKELSPEEVTTNTYTMVDVLLHNIQLQLQHGHLLHDLLLRASAGLAMLMWTQEILPFDITLLALSDRDDDPHALRLVVGLLLDRPEFLNRVQHHLVKSGQSERINHWDHPGPFQRPEPQQALGQHLAGKDRYPIFFDEMCLRALPIIPLIMYRLIENDATETAERLLASYSGLFFYHPAHFTFVRDTLAYFYGSLPSKLVVRLLGSLDLTKIPFSDTFLQHVSLNTGNTLSHEYYSNLLHGLVTKVIPPWNNVRSKASSAAADVIPQPTRSNSNRSTTTVPTSGATTTPEVQKAFYQHQDPGTYTQLVLETAVVELLSLPPPPNLVVTMLVNAAVRIPSPPPLGGHSGHGTPRSPLLPTSPTNVGTDSSNSGSISVSQSVSLTSCPLVIQACGLLLAQLPTAFHGAFYSETARIIKDSWWVTDINKPARELGPVFSHVIWDPTWAVQDEMSNVLGNTLALVHTFGVNLPYDWLEGMHAIIKLQRPVTSVVHLRLAYRIMGPLLSRLVISRTLFTKTLVLLFAIMADVFGKNSPASPATDLSEISDLVDFLHHAVILEGQGPNNIGGRPRPETLTFCTKAVDMLHPDLKHLFRHLSADVNTSIYAATHPKMTQIQMPASSFGTSM
ncbi:unnamed protein product [Calypogeia fissa]